MLATLLTGSAPRPKPAEQESSSTSTPTVPAHVPEIRLALVGPVTDQNVWALFGGDGYTYNSYAVRSKYWPRLYGISLPNQQLEERAANGAPPAIHQEGTFYTGTVWLRTDLRWTDGSSFSAEDVAFTANSVLRFELGFDWGDSYDPERLDHAEAVTPDSVKFFFKVPPGVDDWQYGALQGPVVQQRFWASKVAAAAELLPEAEAYARIEGLRSQIAPLQDQVNDLYVAIFAAHGQQDRELQTDLRRQQGNLDEANNALAKAQAALQGAMQASRTALFAQDDSGEPHLGPWLPDPSTSAPASATKIVNAANPMYPGPAPNFERVVYSIQPTREAARRAFAAGQINLILDPQAEPTSEPDSVMLSPSRRLRLLHFNLDSAVLSDAALRGALACMIDQTEMAATVLHAAPLTSIVAPQEAMWYNAEARLPCAGLDSAGRLAQAVEMLKTAGYTWEREPSPSGRGRGLKRADGIALPGLHLLAPGSDEARTAAAMYVQERASMLGMPLSMQAVSQDALDFMVFSSEEFDMAILGWQVGAFPGYACDWFNADGVFGYGPGRVTALCGELEVTSDLERARGLLAGIQNALTEELPVIPLYSVAVEDRLHGISYPFASILDGLSGVYGAPEMAFPVAP